MYWKFFAILREITSSWCQVYLPDLSPLGCDESSMKGFSAHLCKNSLSTYQIKVHQPEHVTSRKRIKKIPREKPEVSKAQQKWVKHIPQMVVVSWSWFTTPEKNALGKHIQLTGVKTWVKQIPRLI